MNMVRVEPSGVIFGAEPDETIMGAARRNGFTWPSVCGGEGSCRTCFVIVVDGPDWLSPIGGLEQRGINELLSVRTYPGPVRLACQARPVGDVVVTRSGCQVGHVVVEVELALRTERTMSAMPHESELVDRSALQELSYRYAAAVDARDGDAFADVFMPQGRLLTYAADQDTPFVVQTGHHELRQIPELMSHQSIKTMHMMTNHLYEIDHDDATGSIYCTARHLNMSPLAGVDLLVLIRYEDVYRREEDRWRILDRHIRFLWSETHASLTYAQTML